MSQVSQVLLARDLLSLHGSPVHELEQDLDFSVVVEHVVALDHVWVVDVAKDLDLAADLAPDRLLVVPVDHLQRVEPSCRLVDHLVDRAAGAASDAAQPLQLREEDELITLVAGGVVVVVVIVVVVVVVVDVVWVIVMRR